MANFVFKLKGLGADPTLGLSFPLGDNATIRALNRLRSEETPETNEQLLTRLWTKFMSEFIAADYSSRRDTALTTAAFGITKEVSTPVTDIT